MRLVFNLIDRGTSPIFQGQNGLSPVAAQVEIAEESQEFFHNAPCLVTDQQHPSTLIRTLGLTFAA
jgi:hypothetical protein